MGPAALYVNYSIQFLSSLVTVVLNTSTLFGQLKANRANAQLTMVLSHMFIHLLFAFPTVFHSGYGLLATTDPNRCHPLIFWTGNFAYSTVIATGLADMFLGIDRYVAITRPMVYKHRFKNRFTVFALVVCAVAVLIMVFVIVSQRVEAPPEAVGFAYHTNQIVIFIHVNINIAFSVLNVLVTTVFMVKLRKFNRSLQKTSMSAAHRSDLAKANKIVIYQMALEIAFHITPTFVTCFVMYAFGWNWPLLLGPYPFTLLSVYIFACSILYRIKLGKKAEVESIKVIRTSK
ncbi:hypothetical protein QR680_007679 [Steinernema hermaphroditum]|uniref:G-protein coupled receptors family 1 profile domain-containing protein n=1 Tax=Steinernema hermaphroditum TaxID=289476 RepID=A0AA39IG43_9BILA|nr:hypothetical protein QR680_007679 [Steinernema hermaphroditum]